MQLLLIFLIALAIISLGGWGYGTFRTQPLPGPTRAEMVAPRSWANPLGIIGLIAIIGLIVVLVVR